MRGQLHSKTNEEHCRDGQRIDEGDADTSPVTTILVITVILQPILIRGSSRSLYKRAENHGLIVLTMSI